MSEHVANQMIYLYMGDGHVIPRNATRIRVHESVIAIPPHAFEQYPHLVELICHDGVKTIGYRALYLCPSLKLVQIPGVIEIMAEAFAGCPLTHVTFEDKLERILKAAFRSCKSMKSITIPLKEDMLGIVEMPFYDCDKLERVDIVESLHKAIAAFQFEEWTDDMNLEVLPMINGGILSQTPNHVGCYPTPGAKNRAVRMWIASVLYKFDRYKAQHLNLLKEASTTLELALWKMRLNRGNSDVPHEGDKGGRAKCRDNCGADMTIIIPNVLSFLKIE